MAHKCHVGEETVPPTTGAKVTSQHVNKHSQGTTHQVPPTTPTAGIRKLPWMHAHQVAAVSDQMESTRGLCLLIKEVKGMWYPPVGSRKTALFPPE